MISFKTALTERRLRVPTKAHFGAIAHAICSSSLSPEQKKEVADRLATVYHSTSASFDVAKFVRACVGKSSPPPVPKADSSPPPIPSSPPPLPQSSWLDR